MHVSACVYVRAHALGGVGCVCVGGGGGATYGSDIFTAVVKEERVLRRCVGRIAKDRSQVETVNHRKPCGGSGV
jgi:hypothetical protein